LDLIFSLLHDNVFPGEVSWNWLVALEVGKGELEEEGDNLLPLLIRDLFFISFFFLLPLCFPRLPLFLFSLWD